MRTKRSELEKLLSRILKEIKHEKNKIEAIKTLLAKHGMLRGDTQKIIIGETNIESLDESLLCLLTMAVYDATGLQSINPFGHFTPKAIDEAKNINVAVSNEKNPFPIVFQNVIQTGEKDYVAFESARNLIKLYNSNILEYNYNITRNFKLVKNVVGKLVHVVDINMREVKSIAEKIQNNEYSIDKIVINIADRDASISFNKEARKLVVNESQIDIIDGAHEISALAYIMEENPNFEIKIQIEVKNYNEEEIKAYFNQLKLKGGVN